MPDASKLVSVARRPISPEIDDPQRHPFVFPLSTLRPADLRLRALLRARTMQRVGSYLAAIVLILATVAAVSWGLKEHPLAIAQEPAQATYRYEAMPVGADGALKDCVVCHSVERGGTLRAAPPLAGIVGAPKARSKWFGYSIALQKAGGTWTEPDLDKFLTSPSAFLPGTSKTILGYPDGKKRAEIIAALKTTP
jgi:cytochrome c